MIADWEMTFIPKANNFNFKCEAASCDAKAESKFEWRDGRIEFYCLDHVTKVINDYVEETRRKWYGNKAN